MMNIKILMVFFVVGIFALSFAHATGTTNNSGTTICFSGTCNTLTLSPQQVQDLWDGFLYKFLKPSEIASGKDAVAKLAKDTNSKGGSKTATNKCDVDAEINIVDKNSPVGASVKVGCNSQGADAQDFTQNESCTGDFAYGLVLNDTLRLGRCLGDASPNVDKNKCSVYEYALGYRNAIDSWSTAKESLKGLLPSLKDGWGASALTSSFTKNVTRKPSVTTKKDNSGFLQKNKDGTADENPQYTGPSPDLNDLDKKIGQKEEPTRKHISNPKDIIHNSIFANDFQVQFQDVCAGADAPDRCKLYIYSVFNRFYNSYYSGSMIVGAFAPTVYGLSTKVIKKTPGLKGVADKFSEWGSAIKRGATFGGFDSAAKDAADAARKMGLPAEDLVKLDGALNKKSVDAAAPIIEDIVKGFKDDPQAPQKIKALTEYLSTKASYGKIFADTLSTSSKQEAVELLIEQDHTQSALGQSLVKTFYKKEGAKYADFYAQPDSKVTGVVSLSDKSVKKKVLEGKISELYEAKKLKSVGPVNVANFDNLVNSGESYFYYNSSGVKVYLTDSTLDIAKDAAKQMPNQSLDMYIPGSKVKLSATRSKEVIDEMRADFIKLGKETATDVSDRSKDLINLLQNEGVLNRKYFNLLQWMIFNKDKSWRLNPINKFGWSILAPQVYWVAKTSNGSPFKAYFVGKRELSNATLSTGKTRTYDDAYVDFFANKKFSSGDYFGELIIANAAKLAAKIAPGKVIPKQIISMSGVKVRDDVKDIALYTGTKNCSDCKSGTNGKNGVIHVKDFAKNDTQNYILELPDKQTALKGLSLALFNHHTNIDFSLNGSKGNNINDKINIDEAIANGNTCLDKIKTSPIFNLSYFKDAPARAGAVLGIADNVVFYLTTGFLPGFAGMGLGFGLTWLMDVHMMDHFNGCVDSEEGYYIHYIHALPEEKKKDIGGIQSLFTGSKPTMGGTLLSGSDKSPAGVDKINSAVEKIKTKLFSLVSKKKKEFMQIDYKTYGHSSAVYSTQKVFLRWIGPRAMCNQTKEDNKSVIAAIGKDQNGKSHTVVIDKAKKTISVDNKTILKSDLVGLAQRNGVFGGFEIPQSVTFMPADLEADYFEISPNGNFKILDPSTKLCAMEGAAKQSGLNYSNILQYTGLAISTHTTDAGELDSSGSYFSSLGGPSQRDNVKGNLVVDKNVDVINKVGKKNFGQLTSVEFQKALLLYQATKKQFALWIRITAQMNGKDVQTFKGTPTTFTNPKTGCDEQAVDLSVMGNQNDVTAKAKGKDFDTALKKAGPFQYFETPDNVIMFYSKDINGVCKKYMKVIDKKTGKVITDSEISSVSTDPKGNIKIRTADGQTHTLGFSNENGQPTLTFDGKKAPLLMAQGRNGSFYFNPSTGKWTVGNSQMLPFDDKFATQGWRTTGGITKAAGNPIIPSTSISGEKGGLDIPLFGGNERYLFVFASLLVAMLLLYFTKFYKN